MEVAYTEVVTIYSFGPGGCGFPDESDLYDDVGVSRSGSPDGGGVGGIAIGLFDDRGVSSSGYLKNSGSSGIVNPVLPLVAVATFMSVGSMRW